MADLFDSALNLEEQFQQEGYEEGLRWAWWRVPHGSVRQARSKARSAWGFGGWKVWQLCHTAVPRTPLTAAWPMPLHDRDGRRSGRAEGRALGLQKGFEIGHEVGFYAGCCHLWRQLQEREPALFRCGQQRTAASARHGSLIAGAHRCLRTKRGGAAWHMRVAARCRNGKARPGAVHCSTACLFCATAARTSMRTHPRLCRACARQHPVLPTP